MSQLPRATQRVAPICSARRSTSPRASATTRRWGQILAANVVRELAAGKDFLFADLGETELRGFEDPIKLWELRWQER